jgi:hypothetical protein
MESEGSLPCSQKVKNCQPLAKLLSWRTTPFRNTIKHDAKMKIESALVHYKITCSSHEKNERTRGRLKLSIFVFNLQNFTHIWIKFSVTVHIRSCWTWMELRKMFKHLFIVAKLAQTIRHVPGYHSKYLSIKCISRSRGSSVNTVTRLRAGRLSFNFRQEHWRDLFLPPLCPDRFCGPPSLLSNGHRVLFPWSKAAGAWSWPLIST